MAAIIRSLLNGVNPVVGLSRNDARAGDIVTLEDIGPPATSYAWSLAYVPQNDDRVPSSAVLAGPIFSAGPVSFVVDFEGSYLVRIVEDAGLPTQNEQYVRIRFLTQFGKLSLVAAGERRDSEGVIPVDASPEGWANDQNFNINAVKAYLRRVAASGRIIYVDANRGLDNNNPQNNPAIAESYADFSSIQAAITAATSNPEFNGGIPPSAFQPVIIAVRPGFYVEDVVFQPFVHIIGWPSSGGGIGTNPDVDRSVTIRCANAGGPPPGTHTANLPNLGEYVYVSNLVLENTGATTNALLRKIGLGDAYFENCEFLQTGGGAPNQGASVSVERGRLFAHRCRFIQQDTFNADSLAFTVQASVGNTASLRASLCAFVGTSIGRVDALKNGGGTCAMSRCSFEQTGVNPASFGVHTWAEDAFFEDCHFVAQSPAIVDVVQANPDATGAAGDLRLRMRQCVLGTSFQPPSTYLGVSADDTNVIGTAYLFLGACEFSTITATPGVTRSALAKSETIFYDDTLSGLGVQTVQEAIDAIAGSSGAPVNASYLVLVADATLTQERVLTPSADLTGVDSGPGLPYTLGLSNTGVVAGAYTRANITVDVKGRITTAASNPGSWTFSKQSIIPIGAAILPPFNINTADIIGFPFAFAGGGNGPVAIYIDESLALAPGSVFVDVLVGAPGAPASILAAPFDISALPNNTLSTPTMGGGPFSFGVGDIIIFRVTYNVVPAVGAGLTIALTGTQS